MSRPDEILFISDLHLDQNKPQITENFLTFLKTRATKARVLYILGDLFEVWIGDDALPDYYQPVITELKRLSQSVEIYFMAGNRDFLISEQLASQAGFKIITEPFLIELGVKQVVILHGDLLCTDDVDYLAFRKLIRNAKWQTEFLGKSIAERLDIAAGLRAKSAEAMKNKSSEIMDVNLQAVQDYFIQHHCDVIIHGHTHRPAVHDYPDDQQRIVLGDWCPQSSYLTWIESEGFQLVDRRI